MAFAEGGVITSISGMARALLSSKPEPAHTSTIAGRCGFGPCRSQIRHHAQPRDRLRTRMQHRKPE